MDHFADSLKNLRQAANLTMQALADKANVSKSMICKIECNAVQPTLDVASRLARALGKTLSEMLHTPQTSSIVFLPKEQQAIWQDTSSIKRRNISPVFEGLKLEWLQVELPPHSAIEKCIALNLPGIEKYILVSEGILEVHIGQDVFTLKKGDSLYFNATQTHSFYNKNDEPVDYFIVVKYN